MHLNHDERDAVLQELEEVMSVYDTPCDMREPEVSEPAAFPQTEALVLG